MTLSSENKKLVYTIHDNCRVCYTCVRECPVKGIRIVNGQAEIICERCIGCGNCTKVCSQGAKAYLKLQDDVMDLLYSREKVVALVAPSFAAEFPEIENHEVLVEMIRELGFDYVCEVAFGADVVALAFKKLVEQGNKNFISSDCPAIVAYIEQYVPELVENLAPVISPVMAMSRIVKEKYGKNIKTVFIGPCIAKKGESEEVDYTITFTEIRDLFAREKIVATNIRGKSEFDPPLGGKGAIFPVSRGLLQTMDIKEDAFNTEKFIVAEGRRDFQEAIREFKEGFIKDQNLELLCCEGCIMGPGTSEKGLQYARRLRVNDYVKKKFKNFDTKQWEKDLKKYSHIDFSRNFFNKDQRLHPPTDEVVQDVLAKMNKKRDHDHLNCGACGYDTCYNHAVAIAKGLAEIEMCLPYTIDKLHKSIDELAISNDKLINVQQALKQTEKLAHMGQLSAGIAHELNNPLGVIIMYSNILLDECKEDEQFQKDLELIVEQSERCKKIVGGLLNFARKNQVNHKEINITQLVKQSISAIIVPGRVKLDLDNRLREDYAELDSEQMIQVLSNLIKNGIEAMPDGGEIKISLEDTRDEIKFCISDTGSGIKKEDLDKIFEPFYTTKGIGMGTGLGLATAYGVVKMHKGKITVTSNSKDGEGPTGTTFTITLPRLKMN